MADLTRRFERPNEANRWDKPLFVVDMSQPLQSTGESPCITAPSVSGDQSVPSLNASSDIADTAPLASEDQHAEGITVPPPSTNAPVAFATSSWTSKKKGKASAPLSCDLSSVVSSSTAVRETAAHTHQGVYFSGSLNISGGGSCPGSTGKNASTIVEQIVTFFQTAAVPVPNAATMQVKHADAELLYQLDRVSQMITQKIMSHQQMHSDGTPLVLEEFNSQVVALPRYVSLAEMQRLRGQFVKINAQHPPADSIDVGAKFVEFLINQI